MSRRSGNLDFSFLEYLSREIITLNPIRDCKIHGNLADWALLPKDKSLFYSDEGYGLPIGNLTSQLFSNVYLNELDQYMKRTLCCRHYGRYVDDFYVVSGNRQWLRSLIPQVRDFLNEKLGLKLHEGKIRVCNVQKGVEFLGAYLKPYRRYINNKSLVRINKKFHMMEYEMKKELLRARLNSILGILSHHRSWHIQLKLFSKSPYVYEYGSYVWHTKKFIYRLRADDL